MTVDRSYLPYRSARHYQDRKMAKWMGFFLSEHTTALSNYKETTDFSSSMSLDEKLLRLRQLYAQQLAGCFTIIKEDKPFDIVGTIDTIQADEIGIQGEDAHYFIAIHRIISIQLEEVFDNGFEETTDE